MDKAYQQYMRFSLIQNIALIAAVVFFATFTEQYWAMFFIFLLVKEFPLVNPGPSQSEEDEDQISGSLQISTDHRCQRTIKLRVT